MHIWWPLRMMSPGTYAFILRNLTIQSGRTLYGIIVTIEEITVPHCLLQVDRPISKDTRNQHVKGKVKSKVWNISIFLCFEDPLAFFLVVMDFLKKVICWIILHEITNFGNTLTHLMPFYHLTLLMKELIVKTHIACCAISEKNCFETYVLH